MSIEINRWLVVGQRPIMGLASIILAASFLGSEAIATTDAQAPTVPAIKTQMPAIKAQIPTTKIQASIIGQDVRVIVDISGSMKKNDPHNLRVPAVQLLTKLLPEKSQAGVWTFAKMTNMLVPLGQVDAKWRQVASHEVKQINSIGQFTHIGLALDKTWALLPKSQENIPRHCILLSDGMVDIDKDPQVNEREKNRILKELLPRFKQHKIKIHTIALSNEADQNFLSQLSFETSGYFAVALSADALMQAFLKAFDEVVPQQQVPIQDNQFMISSDIEEFTALILLDTEKKEETILFSPDGKRLSFGASNKNVQWDHTEQYDLITISHPAVGQWGVQAAMQKDSRVTVVSDLNLQIADLMPHVFSGQTQKFSVSLMDKNDLLQDKNFLSLLDVDLVQTNQTLSKAWQVALTSYTNQQVRLPEAGGWFVKLNTTITPGEHEVVVHAKTKTFDRKVTRRFQVLDELLRVSEKTTSVSESKSKVYFDLELEHAFINEKEIQVEGVFKNEPSGKTAPVVVQKTADRQWRVDVPDEWAIAGTALSLTVRAETASSQSLSLSQGPYVLKAIQVQPPEVIIEPQLEEKPAELVTPPVEMPANNAPADDAPADSNQQSWLLAVIVGVANVMLIGIGWFIYRTMLKKADLQGKLQEEAIQQLISKEKSFSETAKVDTQENLEMSMDQSGDDIDEAPQEFEQAEDIMDKIEDFGVSKDFDPGDKS